MNTSPATYIVLGAGMQGTAAAYDLAQFANPKRLILADTSLAQAQSSADRVNQLLGRECVEPVTVDALDPVALGKLTEEADVLLSCVPYWMHPRIARVCISTRTSMLDLGGNTEITQETLAMDADAKAAGVTLIPDCGLAPGLVNSLAVALMERLDTTESVKLICGVLPQTPQPPLNYKVTFNVEGLVAEYDYEALALRGGEIVHIPTLSELETVEETPLGTLEAFVTSGGTSTAPETFKDRLRDYEYKTFRFPGHCAAMRLYRDFGLWREDAIEVKGHDGHPVQVRPKDVFVRVFGEALSQLEDRDQCVIRAEARGLKDGAPKTLRIDIHDKEDESTGFTSMERLTGFSLAIHAAWVAKGEVAPGAIRYELATRGEPFLAELRRRGIALHEREIES